MLYISAMKSSSLIKLIEKEGWELIRTKGSHHHFKHQQHKGIVTVPHPKKRYSNWDGKCNIKTGGSEIVASHF